MKLSLEEQLLLAATLATKAHDGHVRKDGSPYIAHPVRVAIRCDSTLCKIVALLHDVVEDTPYSLQDLRDAGFSKEVVDAIDGVTKRPGEKYADFILRAASNPTAKEVKICDIEDNLSDQSALEPDEAEFLKERYTKALKVLHRKA